MEGGVSVNILGKVKLERARRLKAVRLGGLSLRVGPYLALNLRCEKSNNLEGWAHCMLSQILRKPWVEL